MRVGFIIAYEVATVVVVAFVNVLVVIATNMFSAIMCACFLRAQNHFLVTTVAVAVAVADTCNAYLVIHVYSLLASARFSSALQLSHIHYARTSGTGIAACCAALAAELISSVLLVVFLLMLK